MAKGYLTHFSIVFLLHIVFLVWGQKTLQSDFSSSVVAKLGPGALTLKIGETFPVPEVKKVVRSKSLKKNPEKEAEEVKEVAQAASNPAGLESGEGAVGTANPELISVYKAELRARIDKNKYYPPISRRLGQTGIVVVAFTLLEDGNIINVRIESPSRYERLNDSALEAVKKVERFKPIPKEIGQSSMDITVPLKFVTI